MIPPFGASKPSSTSTWADDHIIKSTRGPPKSSRMVSDLFKSRPTVLTTTTIMRVWRKNISGPPSPDLTPSHPLFLLSGTSGEPSSKSFIGELNPLQNDGADERRFRVLSITL